MSIVVEHEKRRKEILEKALDVFIDSGFENATFQKIADRCDITRTTLYLYFKNKKEIFNYSIKQFLANVEEDIRKIVSDTSRGYIDKLTNILLIVFNGLDDNRRLLSVVLHYLLHLSRKNIAPERRIRRRTLRLRRFFAYLIIEGIKAGEIKKVNVKTAVEYLYNFIESAIFQLAILKRENAEDLRKTIIFAVKQLSSGL